MRKVRSWFVPEHEVHMIPAIERDDAYQAPHRQFALRKCRQHRTAIDIGAHIGLWARDLGFSFKKVHCFEPVAEFRQALRLNTSMHKNVEVHPYALGEEQKVVHFKVQKDNTGNSHVDIEGKSPLRVQMMTLDSFKFDSVDFIKMDCEGWELFILKGAVETLKRFRPIINLEQKKFLPPGVKQYDALKFLQTLGARELGRVVDDIVVGW